MAERFTEALGKQFFNWSAWVFGVIGCIGSFVLGQAYAWIGWLMALSGFLALTAHAFAKHHRVRVLEEEHKKRVQELEEVNRKRVDELEQENRKLIERATEAERRLNAVPMAMVEQLVQALSDGVSAQSVELVEARIRQVERLRKFLTHDTKPLNPRTFASEAGRLYAIARLADEARAALLVEGDVFRLVRRGPTGVTVECARLRVHQPPADGTVMFEVSDTSGGEMTALGQLAGAREVTGINGYFIEPAMDVSGYPDFNAENVIAVVSQVMTQIGLRSGGSR